MKKNKITQEEQDKIVIENKLRLLGDISHVNKPTRFFKVGEEVVIGRFDKCIIIEPFNEGLFYKVFCKYTDENYGKPIELTKSDYWYWHDIFPISLS